MNLCVGMERLLSLFPEYGAGAERPWSTAKGERRRWQSLINFSEASVGRGMQVMFKSTNELAFCYFAY